MWNILKKIGVSLCILLLVMEIWHPYPYNTELICFSESGEIVFYAQGHNPSESPVVGLTEGVYKLVETGEKLVAASCRSIWSANKPKGEAYWSTNN